MIFFTKNKIQNNFCIKYLKLTKTRFNIYQIPIFSATHRHEFQFQLHHT